MVLGLYCREAAEVWEVYQDVMNIAVFASSEEAAAVNQLIAAYQAGSEDEIKECIKKNSCFQYLDTALGRLAMKLPNGDVKELSKRLKELGGEEVKDEEDDGDLT